MGVAGGGARRGGAEGSRGALLLVSPEEMDQEYERRLLRQINHQNLPAEARLSKVRRQSSHVWECWCVEGPS